MDVKGEVEPRDFSQPWKLSDAVLVVEEERLHVHRALLALSSPVFEKMFTSEFQEKDSNEIPLAGKSSTEFKELLLMIYPLASEKQITLEIVTSLWSLLTSIRWTPLFRNVKISLLPNWRRNRTMVSSQTWYFRKRTS